MSQKLPTPVCDKVGYHTQTAAKQAIAGINASARRTVNQVHKAYRCRECGKWHINSHSRHGLQSRNECITFAEINLRPETIDRMHYLMARLKK